jgi:hypothetical protein
MENRENALNGWDPVSVRIHTFPYFLLKLAHARNYVYIWPLLTTKSISDPLTRRHIPRRRTCSGRLQHLLAPNQWSRHRASRPSFVEMSWQCMCSTTTMQFRANEYSCAKGLVASSTRWSTTGLPCMYPLLNRVYLINTLANFLITSMWHA